MYRMEKDDFAFMGCCNHMFVILVFGGEGPRSFAPFHPRSHSS